MGVIVISDMLRKLEMNDTNPSDHIHKCKRNLRDKSKLFKVSFTKSEGGPKETMEFPSSFLMGIRGRQDNQTI